MPAIKVSMVSLGCSKNQIDGEMLLAKVQNKGYILSGEPGESDIVIVNTCGFIQSAKEEAIENILELGKLKADGTIKGIIVTGCLAERYKDDILSELPEVDAVIGIGSNDKICEAIVKVMGKERFSFYGEKEDLTLDGERVLTTLPHYSYIKIAEGCDNCCSYCAIPSIRGRFRSRPMEEILGEARWLAEQGTKEIIVIAQDTTRYGEDLYGEYKLAELLRKLAGIEGIKWIRTLYCYPDKITGELLEVMATEPKVVPYLDIPIQHCNDEILKSMNRNPVNLRELFTRIRAKVPNITLRTTLITGFPNESEEQFLELCDFVSEIKFDRLGCFPYSAEEGTPAATMDNQIDDEDKERRASIIMENQTIIMTRLNEEKVGTNIEIMVEGYDKFGECYFGRTVADAPEIDGVVFFDSKASHTMGDFVTVHITHVMDYDLVGNLVEGDS